MCDALPDQTSSVLERARRDGLAHAVLPDLARAIQKRARACAAVLRRESAG
ncbi:MAG: hypothetical protein KF795_28205 [Labilithrix sp.]|nr:hypothetical protein [Labilithrix sp.]